MSRFEVLVGTSDIDEMNHLNNQKYVYFMEKGRLDLYCRAGYSDVEMKERGLGVAVVEMTIQFLKEVALGEKLVIDTYPTRVGNSSFTLIQDIYNEQRVLVSKATVISCIFDFKKRKSTSIPEDLRKFFEQEMEKRTQG
mgnify:CR=1 FL=1